LYKLTMLNTEKTIRRVFAGGLLVLAVFCYPYLVAAESSPIPVTVYKTPTCGCCQAWVEYTDRRLHSCHTAVIGDYLIEGHVPVMDIERLLSEKPDVIGLTAPGMPMLSPGMNSIEPKDYDVLSFDRDGNVKVFSRY